ncbi:MAG TPA: PilZ domain-containing protein [Planctomycetota bacterium]
MPDEDTKTGDYDSKRVPPQQKVENIRRWPRFKVDDAANVVLYPEKLVNFMGLGKSNRAKAAVNLSEGGVLVRTTEKIPRGTRVRLTISIDKFSDRFECVGIVRWCYGAARSKSDYYMGVSFLDLPPADIKKIEKMRGWFTSPEYKAKTKFRQKPPSGPDLIYDEDGM